MICVSYTRRISNCLAMENPKNAIGLQNEAISGYLKKKGWKLAGKYSDRRLDREDETAFLKMKQDGMCRKFECVVFSSLFYCGKKLNSATDLLMSVFYPAGIHFAVAEDDFCSAEATPEEVKTYIQNIRHEHRGRNASQMTSRYSEKTAYKRYGYVRVGEEELEIDPEAAEIIREIFDLSLNGKSMKEIAHILNGRSVESCMEYRSRKTGIEYKHGRVGWTPSSVSGILENPVYMGQWHRCIRGEKMVLDCPPIVSKELFGQVRAAIRKRDNAKGKCRNYSGRSLFTRKIVDLETDWPLHVYELPKDKTKVFRFRYPAPVPHAYETLYLPCADVKKRVEELLESEQKKSEVALKKLSGTEARVEKEKRTAAIRKKAQDLFFQMAELESQMVPMERLYRDGCTDADTYECKRKQIEEEIAGLDAALQSLIDQIKEIREAFSEKNPWVKLYRTLVMEEGVTEEIVKKYVCKVKVFRFEQVLLQPYFEEWFQKLPQEWFTDMEDQ